MTSIKMFCISIFQCFKNISLKLISFVMLASILLAIGLISLPIILDQPLIQEKLSRKISDWTGGNLSFTGAIELSYFPQLSLKAEHVFLRDIRRLPHISKMRARSVTAKFQWGPLLFGQLNVGALELEKPEIYFSAKDKNNQIIHKHLKDRKVAELKRIFKTIKNIPFTDVIFKDALLVIPNAPEAGGRSLYKFAAHLIKEDGKGNFSGEGYAFFKGQKIAFSGETEARQEDLLNAVVPLEINLSNSLFSGRFKGDVGLNADKRIWGITKLKLIKAGDFARWLGLKLKKKQAFPEMEIAGIFEWANKDIRFKNAFINIDNSKAEGSLAFNYKRDRPVLSGKVAFSLLDLTSYQDKNYTDILSLSANNNSAKPVTRLSLLDYFDSDLRISATKVLLGKTEALSAVSTLLVQDGKVHFQLADSKVYGGRLYGRLKIKEQNQQPQYTLAASFKNILSESLVGHLSKRPLMTGHADFHFDLTGRGQTVSELLASLKGNIKVATISSGNVGLDIADLFNLTNNNGVTGSEKWDRIFTKQTAFEKMTAHFRVANGQLGSNQINIFENGYLLSVSGQMGLENPFMKWSFDRTIPRNKKYRSIYPVKYGIESTRRLVAFIEGERHSPRLSYQYVGVNATPVKLNIVLRKTGKQSARTLPLKRVQRVKF